MLQAVIFDFDGVITDSEILHLRAFNTVLAPLNVQISKQDYYKDYLGLTDMELLELLAKKGVICPDKTKLQELALRKGQVFEQLAKKEGNIIEGVRDFLHLLANHNIPMAICSGALLAEIELILENADLRRFFDVIVSAEQVKKGKPDPEGFILTLEKLNQLFTKSIAACDCVVIEDSHWGLTAANKAGMHTVAVTNSYDPEHLSMAEKIVSRLTELTIEELQQLCT